MLVFPKLRVLSYNFVGDQQVRPTECGASVVGGFVHHVVEELGERAVTDFILSRHFVDDIFCPFDSAALVHFTSFERSAVFRAGCPFEDFDSDLHREDFVGDEGA